jgi:hypothetical protein
MKTMVKTLLFAGILSLTLQMVAGPGSISPSVNAGITYVVNIVPQQRIGNVNLALYVAITDENGRPVAPVQKASIGRASYLFYEKGPVTGTRIAYMVNKPVVPTNYSFLCAPDPVSGKFIPGETYYFILYPKVARIQ